MIGLPINTWLGANELVDSESNGDSDTDQLTTGLYIVFGIAMAFWLCLVCGVFPFCRYYHNGDSQTEIAPFLPQKIDRSNTIVYPL